MQKLIESRFIAGPDDALATEDVYEVTENAIRSRASGFGDGELAKLAGALRIPFEPDTAPENNPMMDIINALLALLMGRVANFLASMSPSTRDSMPSDISVSPDEVGYAQLDLFWDFLGDKIYINPKDQKTYEMSRALTNDARQKDPEYLEAVEASIDQAAETIVYTKAIDLMVGAGIVAPIPTILNGLSDDSVRQRVAQNTLPRAINPSGNTQGPNLLTLRDANSKEENVFTRAGKPKVTKDRTLALEIEKSTPSRIPLNPWNGQRLEINDEELIGGVAGSNLNDRINWAEKPDNVYWETYEPDTILTERERFTPDYTPGFRDNAGSWNQNNFSTGEGINWEAIEILKQWANRDYILTRFPGLINMILYYYRLPAGEYTLEDEYNKVTSLMNWLKNDWFYIETSNDVIGRLQYFVNASNDAYHLFTAYSESEYRDEVMVASRYVNNNVVSHLKAQFPLAAI